MYNPAIPGALLRRAVDEYPKEIGCAIAFRGSWSDEQFDALVDHPDSRVRMELAEASGTTEAQRAKLADDPSLGVRLTLNDLWNNGRAPVVESWRGPRGFRESTEADEAPLDPQEAAERAANQHEWIRADIAADPRLAPDLVARLATDPSKRVRLAVSMRQDLSETERLAIDCEIGPDDRIQPARWAVDTKDPDQQRHCANSANAGLRRSVAYNQFLPAELVQVLCADEDPVVRLLLCENQALVPATVVLATFFEARIITRARLLEHPALRGFAFADFVDSTDPWRRCLCIRDERVTPELIERLSMDEHPAVRRTVAADPRLPLARVLELFDDPATTERAASNPLLPVSVMERILAGAATLADERVEGTPTVYLGHWAPGQLPPDAD